MFTVIVAIVGALTVQGFAENSGKSPTASSNAYFTKARIAEQRGDAEGAMAAYKEALRLNPRNANAEHRMLMLKKNFSKVAAEGRKKKFGAVKIPEYKLQGATLQEALTALSTLVEKESKGDVMPNFIIQDPAGKLADSELTLVLKNIPAGGVLQYALEQAGAKARYDEHAIVVIPR